MHTIYDVSIVQFIRRKENLNQFFLFDHQCGCVGLLLHGNVARTLCLYYVIHWIVFMTEYDPDKHCGVWMQSEGRCCTHSLVNCKVSE